MRGQTVAGRSSVGVESDGLVWMRFDGGLSAGDAPLVVHMSVCLYTGGPVA